MSVAAAVVAVKLHLRSTSYEYRRALVDMGCRQLKYFYAVNGWAEGKQGEAILSYTRVGKRSRINIQTRKLFAQVLQKGMTHPNIDEPWAAEVLPDSSAVVVIRRVYPRGSLRDHIYHATYHDNFVAKYYKTTPRPFDETAIASIGKQVLQALLHLQTLGIPYTHLSAGNVMLTSSGIARLTETENAFLKSERFYEHIFREFSATHQAAFLLADLNVLAFGCLLYEMSTALPVHQLADLDNLALGLPQLAEIIKSIFHADGTNNLVPTLAELIQEPFFANAKIPKKARCEPTASDASTAGENAPAATSKAYAFKNALSVTDADLIKDALKTNGKLIYPDDEKLYLATTTAATSANSPDKFSKMGGFVVQPKPARVKKARTTRVVAASPSPPPNASAPRPPPPPASSSASPPPPPPPPASASPSTPNKGALLNSIQGFNSGGLRKTVTNDRSGPSF